MFADKVADLAVAKEDGGVNIGVTTGLRLTHYTGDMFAQNEKAHVSDDILAAMLAAEYPNRIKAGKVLQSIGSYRSYYNQGLHGHTPDGLPAGQGKAPKSHKWVDGVAKERAARGEGKAASKPAKAAKKAAKKVPAKKAASK